ncbi:uncharacterized protein LOC126807665 [Patella vulgata]|uniref:uncharacterized protein LOC126807665 n=1 Tax=Patella vulgata TaxID=6465 RepID=UPI00217FD870|nr:uncharacterized protein LOC126807665 [Patella vulgata]
METRQAKQKARLKKIKKLIKYKPHRINDPDDPPLIEEAANCNAECVEALLYAGAHVDLDNSYETPVYRCLIAEDVPSKDKLECLRVLLRFGVDLYEEQSDDEMTPLMLAAFHGETECLEEILKVGYLNGLTPSQYATKMSVSPGSNDGGSRARSARSPSARRFPNKFTPFAFVGSDLPSYEEYQEVYKTDVDFRDFDNYTASLYCLCPFKTKSPAIMMACLKLLHDAGSDFHLKVIGCDSIINEALKTDLSVFRYLTTLGYNMDPNDGLLIAVGIPNISTVHFMLNEGASLTMVHPANGATPLHIIILGQHRNRALPKEERHNKMKEMIRYLMQNNVNVSSHLDGRHTALNLSFLKLDEFSFAREYLLSENISLGQTSYRSLKSCYELCEQAEFFQGKTKLDLLKFLHTCGLSTKSCLTFKEDEDPGSAVNQWLDKMASSAQSLFTICKHRVRGLLGRDIKNKVPGLDIPTHCQDLLLLKDVLSSECFQ